jgi:hypothetical protein
MKINGVEVEGMEVFISFNSFKRMKEHENECRIALHKENFEIWDEDGEYSRFGNEKLGDLIRALQDAQKILETT